MTSPFHKFPTTPHLLWLGSVPARGDKVMTRDEALDFLRQDIVVEEKVDGANLGISFDSNGSIKAQNRGNYLTPGAKDQFSKLWPWLMERETSLFDLLEDRYIVFGEWCFARHSIGYTRLPDYFLAFDVFDKHTEVFLPVVARNTMCREMSLACVPQVASGRFQLAEIPHWIGPSVLYDGPMEGVYLRQADEHRLSGRAKVVRAEFVQGFAGHWTDSPPVANRLNSESS
jgi:hypothetical protein